MCNFHVFVYHISCNTISPERQVKRSHSSISDNIKRQICKWQESNKNKKQEEIAKHFNEKYPNLNINRSTVSKILSQRDKWKAVINNKNSDKTYRHRRVKFPLLDYAMNL